MEFLTTNCFPSVLGHCWFGHLACKNRPRNDLLCVEWDVKPYTLTHSKLHRYILTVPHFYRSRIHCSCYPFQPRSRCRRLRPNKDSYIVSSMSADLYFTRLSFFLLSFFFIRYSLSLLNGTQPYPACHGRK